MKTILAVMLAVLAVSAAAQLSLADTVNYGDFPAGDYAFNKVIENSMTDALPLFGAPTVIGNTLHFAPTSFTSFVTGDDLDLTDSQLSMEIVAGAGHYITTVTLTEKGNYVLTGNGTENTYAEVSAPVWLQVMKVNGVGINPITVQANMVFTPSDTWDSGPSSGNWLGALTLDVTAALRASGISSGLATEVKLTLDDVLTTGSEVGTSAYIEKTEADVNIPEPATLTLLAIGLAAVCGGRRKNFS